MFSIVRPAAAALALSLGLAPAVALAHGHDKGDRGGLVEQGKGKEHARFPMKAEEFKQLVEARIRKAFEHLDRILDKRQVPEAIKAQVKKDFDAGAAQVRAAATKAGADGTVTKAEAKDVRELAKDLRDKAREKYGMGKGEKAKADGKGHGKGRERAGRGSSDSR